MPKKKNDVAVLIWTAAPLSKCLSSGKPIRLREADLTLLGPEPVTYTLELGHNPQSGYWYGLLQDLHEILTDERWDFADVDGFGVDGEPVDAQVFVSDVNQRFPWVVFRELTQKMAEEARKVAEEAERPPPSDQAVRALPELPEAWETGGRAAVWVGDEDEPPQVGFLSVVVDAEGLVRASTVTAGAPPNAGEAADLVRRAAASPMSGQHAGRPRQVRVAGEARAQELGEALSALGIAVAAAPTPLADEALDAAASHLLRSGLAPYLIDYDESGIRAYFRTAQAFYRARPWERFDGDRYLGFRIDGGAWHYASVMGQAGAEPGLSLFETWDQLCRFVHNQSPYALFAMEEEEDEAPGPVEAAGGIEGMTLSLLELLHPEDGAYLLRLGLQPLVENYYPLPLRFTGDGPEPIRFPLPTYRRLMEAVLTVVNRRSTPVLKSVKQTIEVDGIEVDLRYPADGLEPVRAAGKTLPAYRLVVKGKRPSNVPNPSIPHGAQLVVDAPGDAKVYDVARAIRRELDPLWVTGLGSGDVYLWSEAHPLKEPGPALDDLKGLDDLWIELTLDRYPVHLLPRLGDTTPEIQVRMER